MADVVTVRFRWPQTAAWAHALEAAVPGSRLCVVRGGFEWRGADGRALAWMRLPVVLRPTLDDTVASILARADAPLGREVLLLVRAGAAALGLFEAGSLIDHKVFTRYVVRGHGHAQKLHKKTKGRSRYGGRLRLQNARRLLQETNQRLNTWWEAAAYAAVFLSCPGRLWSDLVAAEPRPLFVGNVEPTPVAMHVHEPRHAELLRVRGALEWGQIDSTLPLADCVVSPGGGA